MLWAMLRGFAAVHALLAATVLTALAFVGVYGAFVLTRVGQELENEALLAATLRSPDDVARSLERLSTISVATFAVAVAIVALVALLRGRFALALGAAGAMVLAVATAEVVKDLAPRPALVEGPAWLLRNSFPSGSATVAAAIGVGALLVAPDRVRWAILPLAAIGAAVVGQATQVTGWHRMSCAVGGALLAIGFGLAALAILARRGEVVRDGGRRIDRRVVTALVVAGAGLIGVAAIVTAVAVAFPILRAPAGAAGAFLHTTLTLAGAGVTVLLFAAFGALLDPYRIGGSPTRSTGELPSGERAAETVVPDVPGTRAP